jgi:hypothetical protein
MGPVLRGPDGRPLGYDAKLLALVCQRFAKRVMQMLRHQTKGEHRLHRVQGLHSGVLIVVQRFRSNLGLYVHIHAIAMDGCFGTAGEDDVRFLPVEQLRPPFARLRPPHRALGDLDLGWAWFTATWNDAFVDASDDEFMASFPVPAVNGSTAYEYTYRFSLDDGLTWTYCDLSGAGSNDGLAFDPDALGEMTVDNP